jgi:hypothetical protein
MLPSERVVEEDEGTVVDVDVEPSPPGGFSDVPHATAVIAMKRTAIAAVVAAIIDLRDI